MAHLAELAKLKVLKLDGTKIDDASLKHLARVSTLEELTVHTTAVTPAGLAKLSALPNLQLLNNAEVTDDETEQEQLQRPNANYGALT